LFLAISLINAIVCGESFGCLESALDLRFQNKRKSSRCERQQVLRLHNEERLLAGPHHPRQKQQAEPICLLAGRSFDVSMQDDEFLLQQRVFDQQFGLPFGKVCDRSKQKYGGARFQPTSETIVERVKATSYSLPERDEKREHRLLLCEG
jgi:hypothetical protein